ncbi:glycosyl transferase [Comamonas phosphati]|nr:glycosyl transferase [Comamonas phosphati]
MKILIPVTGFGASGGMRVLSRLADEFIKNGHSVDFLAPYDRSIPYFPTNAKINTIHVDWNFPRYLRYLKFFSEILFLSFWINKHQEKYDLVLSNAWITAYVVIFANAKKRLKKFYYIQAYEPDFCNEQKNPILRVILRFLAKKTYGFGFYPIVNSEIYKNYREIVAHDVVEPGIDGDVFFPAAEDFGKDSIKIGCIGRREIWKGTKTILDAIAIASKALNISIDVEVAFNLPDGVDENEKIKLKTPHGDKKLADFYRGVDIFVATGHIQSGAFHYPCMEAMACGKIVITNYSPGNEDNAIFLNEIDKKVISSKIVEEIKKPKFNKIELIKNSEKIREKYAWNNVARKMMTIFEENLNKK